MKIIFNEIEQYDSIITINKLMGYSVFAINDNYYMQIENQIFYHIKICNENQCAEYEETLDGLKILSNDIVFCFYCINSEYKNSIREKFYKYCEV